MREFIFRIWDTDRKIMYLNSLSPIYAFNYAASCESEPVIMQYTGLKDKNGVKIFEGDIIPVLEPSKNGGIKWEAINRVVEYGNGHFFLKWCAGSMSFGGLFTPNLVVIGNNFEHPELLK